MKSQKELEQLKQEYEVLKGKLSELSEEELQKVCGGSPYGIGEEGFSGRIIPDEHNLM